VRKPEGKRAFSRFRLRSAAAAAAVEYKTVSRLFSIHGYWSPVFPLVDLNVTGRVILKWTLRIQDAEYGVQCCGSEYAPVAGCCGKSGFHKMQGVSRLAEQLLASEGGRGSME
jgi:hypothetical protein